MSNAPFTDADFYGTDGGDDEGFEPLDGIEATEDAAPEAIDEIDGQGEVTEQPEETYLDLGQFSGHKVRVKVDGEEVEVPVEELASGYSRTADYTRKTQELAQQRQELQWMQTVQEALRRNPQAALEYLNKEFGGQQAPAATEADDDDWGSYDDPAAKQLQAFQQQVAPVMEYVQRQQATEYLNHVIDGLSAKYGDAFDANEVVTEALNRGIADPSMLEAVFRDMDYERMRATASAQQHVAADKQATDAQRKAAAQRAASAVGNGSSAPRGRQAAQPQAAPKTIQEAWALAKAEMGLA